MNKRSELENRAFIETGRCIYHNLVACWLTNRGHKTCARLGKFDYLGSSGVELGPGTGKHFHYVKEAQIVGVDAMCEMLAQARDHIYDKGSLVQGEPLFESDLVT